MFLIRNDFNFCTRMRILKSDIFNLNKEFKNILLEQNEEYSADIKNEEEYIIERIPNKSMEQYFSAMFEDVRHERSSLLILSLSDPDILKKAKFTDHEITIIRNLALEKLHRQRLSKEEMAIALLEVELE